MKKLVISAVMLVVGSIASVNATAPLSFVQVAGYQMAGQEKVEIKPEDLPEAVRKTLGGDAYKDWTVSKAFSVTDDKGAQFYEVALTKGQETSSVKLDKDGKVLE